MRLPIYASLGDTERVTLHSTLLAQRIAAIQATSVPKAPDQPAVHPLTAPQMVADALEG